MVPQNELIPNGYDIVVNATPLGMHEGDPLPVDLKRIAAGTFIGPDE